MARTPQAAAARAAPAGSARPSARSRSARCSAGRPPDRGSRRRRPALAAARSARPRRAAAAARCVSNSAATSRAIPACESASGRFGVTLTSRTSSSSPTWRARSAPGRRRQATESRFRHRASPIARARSSLQIMPGDMHAADLAPVERAAARQRRARLRPGDLAARRRHVRRAAHDLLLGAAGRRRRTIDSLSAAGCGRLPRTSATTTPARSRPRRSIASTSSPASVSRSATLSAVTPGLRSTELAQPVEGDLHGSLLSSPELRQKADVVLVERAQVVDAVLEHRHARSPMPNAKPVTSLGS